MNQVKPWYNVWQSEPTPTCIMQDKLYIHLAPCKMDELQGQEKNYSVFLTHGHILSIHKYLPIFMLNKGKYKISKKYTSHVKVNMLQNSSKPSKGFEALQNY